MTVFDVLFIALFLAAAIGLLVAAGAAATGHRPSAGRILRRLAAAAVTYLVIVYAIALVTPGRVLALGEDQCSDDWCMAVMNVQGVPNAGGRAYDVTFRLSSRARRVGQRERGVVAYMQDDHGHRYDGEDGLADPPFDVRLAPLETVLTHRRFVLSPGELPRKLVLTHAGISFPGCCIIGEANGLLHPAALPLQQERPAAAEQGNLPCEPAPWPRWPQGRDRVPSWARDTVASRLDSSALHASAQHQPRDPGHGGSDGNGEGKPQRRHGKQKNRARTQGSRF